MAFSGRPPGMGPTHGLPAFADGIAGAPGAPRTNADIAQVGREESVRIAEEQRAAHEKRITSHNFWTNSQNYYDPKAQFRFMVRIPGMGLEDARPIKGDSFDDHQDASAGHVWYAKTIDKPGYQLIDLTENMYFNSSTKAAPAPQADNPTLKKITMTLIDPVYPNATRKLVRYLRRSGFQETQAAAAAQKLGGADASYVETSGGGISIPKLEIIQLGSFGEDIERWTLIDPYPAEVDFGKLDYSSDDLVEITVTWGYRTFTVDFPAIGNELPYKYFRDTQGVVVPPDDPPLPPNPCKDIPGYKEMYPNECASSALAAAQDAAMQELNADPAGTVSEPSP